MSGRRVSHGIFVDHNDYVWLAGNGPTDAHILKFMRDGTFVQQLGRQGQSAGNADTRNLRRAADVRVDPTNNEVYVADGYGNRRVIVLDGETGAFKRMWGAYGGRPEDRDIGPVRSGRAASPAVPAPCTAWRFQTMVRCTWPIAPMIGCRYSRKTAGL